MREHTLSVMSLEEYEPNREFVGRNFNAGEIIQLVLKSPSTGRWLPFEYVQMVMMHELAHCKQMNHSGAFWAVRNQYATQMYGLWAKGYTGDGIWGRGNRLATGEWERNIVRADEVLPEHLCGGTYRSRRRGKRKAKPTLSYQEKKERRIQKKFGKNGTALGADEETKVKLEKGKRVQGKPRVAGSARGRDLRAAAALARFEQQKEPDPSIKDDDETESGSDSDYEDMEILDTDSKDALDLDGSLLVDGKGRGMVKVCEDEVEDDPGARDESKELRDVFRGKIKTEPIDLEDEEPQRTDGLTNAGPASRKWSQPPRLQDIPLAPKAPARQRKGSPAPRGTSRTEDPATRRPDHKIADDLLCSVCTFSNPPSALRCDMCAHVLNRAADPAAWACTSDVCQGKMYVNAGDCGVCGLCGRKKPGGLSAVA